jgi:hypothetical protein
MPFQATKEAFFERYPAKAPASNYRKRRIRILASIKSNGAKDFLSMAG